MKSLIALVMLALPPGAEEVSWYFDADTALQAARRSGRPVVLLKVRADIGSEVKT